MISKFVRNIPDKANFLFRKNFELISFKQVLFLEFFLSVSLEI